MNDLVLRPQCIVNNNLPKWERLNEIGWIQVIRRGGSQVGREITIWNIGYKPRVWVSKFLKDGCSKDVLCVVSVRENTRQWR